MMRFLGGLIFVCITTCQSYGQHDSLIYTLPRPDLKWGLPNGILISPDNKYFLVSYDYKPSYVDLYEVNGFKKLKTFKIKGHFVYFSSSFFNNDNDGVYIDVGKRININIDIGKRSIGKEKIKYLFFDLQTGKRQKIKCKDGPKGCDYATSSPYRNEILREYFTFDQSLLFKIENKKVNIYKK
jgi:hypothetical protein